MLVRPRRYVVTSSSPLDVADRLAIHELAARYGHVIDDRDWDGLATVFTDDALFVMTGFAPDEERYEGLPAIRRMLETSTTHPVAHHVTNVVVDDGDPVRLRFKMIGPGPGGRVGSADYRDVVVRGPDGWRIAEHRITLRRPEPR